MWVEFPNFTVLTADVVEQCIKLWNASPIDENSFSLPDFARGQNQLSRFKCGGTTLISLDKLKWYQKQKGKKEVKPRVRTITLTNGNVVKLYNCTSVDSSSLKKYVIEVDESSYVIYRSNGLISNLDKFEQKKPRISKIDAAKVRETLDGRSVKCAMKVLKDQKMDINSKQVRNQTRMVTTVQKLNRGVRPTTNPSDFVELTRISKLATCHVEKDEFRFCFFNEDISSLIVKSLPSKRELLKYRVQFEDIENWSTSDLNDYIEANKEHYIGGVDKRIACHLQLDTTFDLSSCYVTVASGYLKNFSTKNSKKLRHVAFGFMLHSSKSGNHHKAFSAAIQNLFRTFDPKEKKRVSAIVHDGEPSFSCYQEGSYFENCILLRCDIHRRSNIERFTNSKVSDDDMKRIFGKMDGRMYLKRGILGALSFDAFVERLEKSKIDSNLKKWILDRKEDFYETNGLKNKILSGLLTQNATTNSIESINSRIKLLIPRPLKGRECAERLVDFLNDELVHLYNSVIGGDDEFVLYDKYDEYDTNFSTKDKIDFLLRAGFYNILVPILEVPLMLQPHLPKNNINDILELKIVQQDDYFMIQKNQQIREFFVVEKANDLWKCSNRSCAMKVPDICIHLCAAFLRMSKSEKESALEKIIEENEKITVTKSERTREKAGQAKRFKRKYTNYSHSNHNRMITGFVDESLDDSSLLAVSSSHSVSRDEPDEPLVDSMVGLISHDDNDSLNDSFLSELSDVPERRRDDSRYFLTSSDDDDENEEAKLDDSVDKMKSKNTDEIQLSVENPALDNHSFASSTSSRPKRQALAPVRYREYFKKKKNDEDDEI